MSSTGRYSGVSMLEWVPLWLVDQLDKVFNRSVVTSASL